MTKLELGRIGVALGPQEGSAFVDAVLEIEALGYSTLWLSGGSLERLGQISDLVRATSTIKVVPGILSVSKFSAASVAALYAELESSHPGRYVVGLGGHYGPRPIEAIGAYLDELDSSPGVPASARVLAALGPKMLGLARDRAAGAYPFLVDPAYTASARAGLGPDSFLAVLQMATLETDAERARSIVREPLGFLSKLPGYHANLLRQGYSAEEIDGLSDRLVDAVGAWGTAETIAGRLREHLDAGADQVVLNPITGSYDLPLPYLREYAAALGLR
ncbi:TIGR03620 family F420-dependent LLM class oxidoreductase [Tenggerimyces flavus]|uniref:TIGR03620 family F420-dependent LLM class oxidoreductase n=1 Tax=Tenggerimyces flavus TaxID=1708749 RepID=A0ABV7YCV6_9ACTN|nr:TIGR03620 family F420-dependent LLM class oxidoreductase [Tenggerimyces flavus]MBM7783452.1 putative F420-dependent oxidoreductase [Tenggerimyces flavus]